MCGICGIAYADPGRSVDGRVLDDMLDVLRHRGPDDGGTLLRRNIGIGNRRLSIIGLAEGRQPVKNEDGSLQVVFNGEIYNYRELTELLRRRGHRFSTDTDTETLVHAYEEFGMEFPEHLNGMFAFALWDERRERLLLARDRVGIKPLYYAFHDGALIFASELRSLLRYPGLSPEVDLASLGEYLSYEYVPTPRSILQNVSKLPPGHLLSWSGGEARISRYWDLDLSRCEGIRPRHIADYERELREILRESVEREMVSDVPVGVLLSGGVDSTAVAAMMTRATSEKIRSFSVSFEDKSFDESRYARMAADFLGTEHHEFLLTEDRMIDAARNLAEHMDEPLGDSSFIPTLLLSKFVREHVKVALGGDGGDELFAGYPTLQAHRLVHYYERLVPSSVRLRLVPWLVDRLPVSFNNISFDFKARRFISGRGLAPVVRHQLWLGAFTPAQKKELLNPWANLAEKDTYGVALEHYRNSGAADELNRILYTDMKLYLEGDILPKVDRASMASSLEVRVPLLNHRLVEYVASLPHELKLRRFAGKYLLKRSLRGLVPPAILKRPKKGFNMPVARWLFGPLREIVEDSLGESRLKNDGFFNPRYVRRLMDEHKEGRHDHRKLLWTLLVFQLWHARYKQTLSAGALK